MALLVVSVLHNMVGIGDAFNVHSGMSWCEAHVFSRYTLLRLMSTSKRLRIFGTGRSLALGP